MVKLSKVPTKKLVEELAKRKAEVTTRVFGFADEDDLTISGPSTVLIISNLIVGD